MPRRGRRPGDGGCGGTGRRAGFRSRWASVLGGSVLARIGSGLQGCWGGAPRRVAKRPAPGHARGNCLNGPWPRSRSSTRTASASRSTSPPHELEHAVEHAQSTSPESVQDPRLSQGEGAEPVLVAHVGKERIYAEAVDSHIGGWFWSAASRARLRPVTEPEYEFDGCRHARRGLELHRDGRGAAAPGARRLDDARGAARRGRGSPRSSSTRSSRRCASPSPSSRRPTTARPRGRHARRRSRRARRRGPAGHRRRARAAAGSSRRSRSALIGATVGETKQIAYQLADGASATVEVTVKHVNEKVLPEIDDELARVGERVRHDRRAARRHRGPHPRAVDDEIDAAFRVAAVDELVRASNVQPAPARSSRRAPRELLNGFVRSLASRGISPEAYFAGHGPDAPSC